MRKANSGAIPEFKVNAAGKTWRYEYLLYGRTPPKYQTTKDGFIIYSYDLHSADRATQLIVSLFRLAAYPTELAAVSQTAPAKESKQIEITVGMKKEDVIKALGEPVKAIVFGKKTFLKYADITVTLEEDKVTEVK